MKLFGKRETPEPEFVPIKGAASGWGRPEEEGVRVLNQEDRDEITNLLVGRKVTKVDDVHILLDNGAVIKAIGRDGGCSCSAGCYDLKVLNGVDNIITRVEFDYHPSGDDEIPWNSPEGTLTEAQKCNPEHENKYAGHYRIFVFADNEKINLMQFDGTDGNGYYGTGFEILVRDPRND